MSSEMNISNLINTKISQFYVKSSNIILDNVSTYFSSKKFLNFLEITKLLKCSNQDLQTYDDYLHCYHKLLPIYEQCSKEVTGNDSINDLYLGWLGYNSKYIEAAFNNVEDKGTAAVEQVLLLTAMLEYSLGNVYSTLTHGHAAPHLLKDLLCTAQLKEVFGVETILFLRILLGSPNSINLRNIVWHGFPKPDQIPSYYASVLLLTIHTLGGMLQTQTFHIKQRPQIEDITNFFMKFAPNFINAVDALSLDNYEAYLLETFSSHCWLSQEYRIYWQQLLHHCKCANYWQFIILILPQIELLLRLIYGYANDYDVSAKLDEYYITMDTIFESTVPAATTATATEGHKNNSLLLCKNSISEGALKCLFDLFIAPNGPRLRDKVSHGEVNMDAINNAALCRILFYLSLNLLTANELKFPLLDYESEFHLNCFTKAALDSAKMQLQHLEISQTVDIKCESVEAGDIAVTKIRIFQRPKKEPVVMLLILKIAESVTQSCRNYEESLNMRLALLAQRELHSKRRRTLEKQLAALPEIYVVLYEVLKLMDTIFIKQQSAESIEFFNDVASFSKLLRFLKHILKICENLVRYSFKDSNEWIKALELCKRFIEMRNSFLEKHENNLFKVDRSDL